MIAALPPALPMDPAELVRVYAAPVGSALFVRLGLVASANGGAADESGWTASLGGAGDRRVLRTLRALADAVVMGAGTANTGRVPYPRVHAEFVGYRPGDAAEDQPRAVVFSRTGELDVDSVLFHGAAPVIVATTSSGAAELERRGARTELHLAEPGESVGAQLARLSAERGWRSVLCEGGPTLAAAMLDDGAVDELCLTLAPLLLPAGSPHWLTARAPAELDLRAAFHEDGSLFLRYAVSAGDGAVPSG